MDHIVDISYFFKQEYAEGKKASVRFIKLHAPFPVLTFDFVIST